MLLLGEQRHNGCGQFAQDFYPTASRLRFEPGPSASESSTLTTRLLSHSHSVIDALYFYTRVGVSWSVCMSVCQSGCVLTTTVSRAETDEPVEMPSGDG